MTLGRKQALIFTSFGVSEACARKTSLDAAAELLQMSFPDFSLFQSYTSGFIRKRLQGEGMVIRDLPELLPSLAAQGYSRVLIQPSHLTAGEEFENKVVAVAETARHLFADGLAVGRPVFDDLEDYVLVLEIMLPILSLQEGESLVWFGHGSPHHHNPVYERLQEIADERQLPVHVGVLEPADTPNFEMVCRRLKLCGTKNILLAPLLLAGGSHVIRDMAGSGKASWKNRLSAAGYRVRIDLRGLGEYSAFRRLYVRKAAMCMDRCGWENKKNILITSSYDTDSI